MSASAPADALMLEVHNNPELAKSDGEQALLPDELADTLVKVRAVAAAIGRE